MAETWKAAELLEEIARRADPAAAVRRMFNDLVKNAREAPHLFGILFDENRRCCTVSYFFPVDTVMKDIDGTPEEVLEWLSTGTTNSVKIELVMNCVPCFAIHRRYDDASRFEQLRELMNETCLAGPMTQIFPAENDRR